MTTPRRRRQGSSPPENPYPSYYDPYADPYAETWTADDTEVEDTRQTAAFGKEGDTRRNPALPLRALGTPAETAPLPPANVPSLQWSEPDMARVQERREKRKRRSRRIGASASSAASASSEAAGYNSGDGSVPGGGLQASFPALERAQAFAQAHWETVAARVGQLRAAAWARGWEQRASRQVRGQARRTDSFRLPSIRLPMNRVGLYFVFSIVFVAAIVVILGRVRNNPAELAPNAIWIGTEWTYDAPGEDAVRTFAGKLAQHRIGTAYAWVSWLQEDNTWRGQDQMDDVRTFVDQMRAAAPDMRLYAWISLPTNVGGGNRLADINVQQQVADFARRTVDEFGFNGVFLNIEPVWNNDENFLSLLRKVRAAVGPTVKISAAIPPDWSPVGENIPVPPLIAPGTVWDSEYKQNVALLVDEMALMAYNSGLSSASDYSQWVAYQVRAYAEALGELGAGTQLVVGIPTYDAEPPGHDPLVENVQSAVAGVEQGILNAGENAQFVQGIALYAGWTTDDSEWSDFLNSWAAQS